MSSFEIGTTSSTDPIDQLTTPLPDPRSTFLPYSRTVGLGNGGTRGLGAPVAQWIFPILEIDQYNQLRAFCADSSAEIYIVTKKDDDSFALFTATMTVPNEPQDRFYGQRKNYTVTFRNLVEQ